MADIGYVRAALNGISNARDRTILDGIFTHILSNIRIGIPEHQTRAVNLQLYWLNTTTPAASTGEFSIAHGLPSVPHYAISVLELDRVGAMTVPLEVTRPADLTRIYMKSTSTNAQILLLVEN